MGNLPYERVNMAPPFSITGLDLGGPYFVTYKHQRKGVLNKIYVCVCFVTRAIHLEILSDLTSDAIIATLKRFMSRRGKCSKIFTDNATNFVGANSQLKVFYKTFNFPDQNLAAYFTEEGIEWNFIPPRAPHMGGLWEAGIKSVKYHLKRALGRSRLTYEEFETVIIQVEGILNSRPLTPISNDFDNFEVLTPAHFLIGRSINSILEPLVINISDNRLSRWQRTTKRGKWMIEKDNVMCGTMVNVKEDFTPVCNWLLGRVVEVYHGSDDRRQEEEPMDWEEVLFHPEVNAPFVPSRPPRKMRSLISVQVTALSANRFPNMRALVPKTEGGVSLHSRGCPERLLKRAASRDQSSQPPSGVPRATLFLERYICTTATMPTFKSTCQSRFHMCRNRRVGS
ncbi:integrase catalytic domain-containing protein [Trichonephila clavipes]|uniref:Integrase catalytic domain-containing protein n=1 Tax=Trichonephila clavipes TaxID=2585209 RepID=A0A8X6RY49_TRICX|nr:integrase catalytic domain-containing protein [Trichonephila clavipes]